MHNKPSYTPRHIALFFVFCFSLCQMALGILLLKGEQKTIEVSQTKIAAADTKTVHKHILAYLEGNQ